MKRKSIKKTSDALDDNLLTEDGYPLPKLMMEYYRVLREEFGRIEIVSEGPSIVDKLKEAGILQNDSQLKDHE